jgi:hypothetical protein
MCSDFDLQIWKFTLEKPVLMKIYNLPACRFFQALHQYTNSATVTSLNVFNDFQPIAPIG